MSDLATRLGSGCYSPGDVIAAADALEAADLAVAAERERADTLTVALLWIDNYDPEIIAAAEKRFGFSLAAPGDPTNV